jgi:hypothetical protein
VRKVFILIIFFTLFIIACEQKTSGPTGRSEVTSVPKVVLEKEKVEGEEPLPPDVKIKLRRDGKDNYSWEINGSDVNQILKVNEKLRKQLGKE